MDNIIMLWFVAACAIFSGWLTQFTVRKIEHQLSLKSEFGQHYGVAALGGLIGAVIGIMASIKYGF